MNTIVKNRRSELMVLDQQQLLQHQLSRFNRLLQDILPANQFYEAKLGRTACEIGSMEEFERLPFTFKQELSETAIDSTFAANLTFPVDQYSRLHRTSGTRGRPLVVLDTADDWAWWMECWQYVLDAAGIEPHDRVVMAFSFGPFIGFWSAYDAVIQRGAMVAPAGGMSTLARIDLMKTIGATVIFCTPSYALHVAEVASNNQVNVAELDVKKIVVAGEPGGSIPAVRQRIETAWDARVIDHSGASEVGPWGFADPEGRGIYVNEAEFIAEFLSIETGQPAHESELSELVLTCLGRIGSPIIRYRTGDLVKPTWNDHQECSFVLLDGGVLGRVDDMLIIRGVNIFPTSIEQILRGFPEIIEFRITAYKRGEMDALKIEIEDRLNRPERVEQEMQVRLGLKVQIVDVPIGSLPRFEGKGKRFVDERS